MLIMLAALGAEERLWVVGNEEYSASYVCSINDTVMLEMANGVRMKVPLELLQDGDKDYVLGKQALAKRKQPRIRRAPKRELTSEQRAILLSKRQQNRAAFRARLNDMQQSAMLARASTDPWVQAVKWSALYNGPYSPYQVYAYPRYWCYPGHYAPYRRSYYFAGR